MQEEEIIYLLFIFSCKYRVLVSTLRDADRWPWQRLRCRQGESKALQTLPHFKISVSKEAFATIWDKEAFALDLS
jgi:hypothetical protein